MVPRSNAPEKPHKPWHGRDCTLYNSVAARMLGEFRRTALALRVYQADVPKGKAAEKLKIHKLAQ
jgi:hypothetical protein